MLGLNTRSNRESIPGYVDDYVSCRCSGKKLTKVLKDLEDAGALKVKNGIQKLPDLKYNYQTNYYK